MQKWIMCWCLSGSLWAFGQSGPTLAGVGYSLPFPGVAPGQVVRLQVTGLQTVVLPSLLKATTIPLPLTLDGISITISQSIEHSIMGTPVQVSYEAPLLSLNQMNVCSSGTTASECFITFITLQVPYDLETSTQPIPRVQTQIVITENGVDSKAFPVTVAGDQFHVITNCEDQPFERGCGSIVAHADGTVVSRESPGKPGEIVVIYAWGLGSTIPGIKSGNLTPTPAPVVEQLIQVRFDFTANAAPSGTFGTASFATGYLTPGFVGLYQVNIQLPATFPAVSQCDQAGLGSNLTINLGGSFSFDGAAVCVQTTQ
jgi:uncharacterized protein (TIGR03437 family)